MLRTSTVMIGVLLVAATPASSQTIRGNVVDAESGQDVVAVTVSLLAPDGTILVTDTSDQYGTFALIVPVAGTYRIVASRLGYQPLAPQEVAVQRADLLLVTLQMSRSPISLAPITVTGVMRDPRHDATIEGAITRRRLFPAIGSRRVVLPTDPEMANAMVVTQVLRWFPPPRGCGATTDLAQSAANCGCMIVHWNGYVVQDSSTATFYLEEAGANSIGAVEYYRYWIDAPMDLKGFPSYITEPDLCAVVALWPPVGQLRAN